MRLRKRYVITRDGHRDNGSSDLTQFSLGNDGNKLCSISSFIFNLLSFIHSAASPINVQDQKQKLENMIEHSIWEYSAKKYSDWADGQMAVLGVCVYKENKRG